MRALVLVLLVGCDAADLSTGSRTIIDLSDAADRGVGPDAAPDPDDGVPPDLGPDFDLIDAGLGDIAVPLPVPDAAPDPDAAPPDPDAAPPGGPLEQRTEQEVCDHWRREHVNVRPEWEATGGGMCDPGQIPAAAQANAIRRTNLYRWLAGLDPIVLNEQILPAQQACATVLAAMRRLSHQLTPDNPCYTPEAAQGARSSNLAGGGTLAGSVDLYITDPGAGNAALGHRRWVLNPGMQHTAFGYKEGFSCMYSFSQGARHMVDFVAWPPPGVVPVQAAEGRFHISLYGLRPGPEFAIEAGLDGPPQPVEFWRLQGGFGGNVPAYGYAPPAQGVWRAGNALTVAIRGLRDHPDVVFTSRFVNCR